jgi:hypothetical protein
MRTRLIATISLVLSASIGIALAQGNPDDATQRVTGCLKKGASNVYLLIDENVNYGVCNAKIFPFPNMSVIWSPSAAPFHRNPKTPTTRMTHLHKIILS